MTGWWRRRAVRTRIALTTGLVTLLTLLGIVLAGSAILDWVVRAPVEDSLRAAVSAAADRVSAGQSPEPGSVAVRVLDTGGTPADDGDESGLDAAAVSDLKGGSLVERTNGDSLLLAAGHVAVTPGGVPRLVVASVEIPGYAALAERATWLQLATAALGALVAGVATWLAAIWVLRPVRRLRTAAAALPAGELLPVPPARDELRELTATLNELIVRRDQAAELLRRFTGDAAHELRSPVTSIRAQAEVAVTHPDPELAQETLQDIVAEAERLSRLVEDLLALARGDVGGTVPPRRVDLVAAAHVAADRCAAAAEAAGVRVRIEPGPPAAVLATPPEVAVVLDNLLRNALRYARGLVRIAVLPAGASVRLIVDDDGPGVPPEHRTAVFERFHRVDDDRGRGTGGAGLGLALVAESVRRRGGSARVGTSPEEGARFEVRWRAAPSEPAQH